MKNNIVVEYEKIEHEQEPVNYDNYYCSRKSCFTCFL